MLSSRRVSASGADKQLLKTQVLGLSLYYNFVTPLTSMVVTKPEGQEQSQVAEKPVENGVCGSGLLASGEPRLLTQCFPVPSRHPNKDPNPATGSQDPQEMHPISLMRKLRPVSQPSQAHCTYVVLGFGSKVKYKHFECIKKTQLYISLLSLSLSTSPSPSRSLSLSFCFIQKTVPGMFMQVRAQYPQRLAYMTVG